MYSRAKFIQKILLSAFAALLGTACFLFGYSRFSLWRAKTSADSSQTLCCKSLFPADADYFSAESSISLRQQNYAAALAALDQALKFKPNDYSLWIRRGQLEQISGDNRKATDSFQKAVALAPNFAETHLHYGDHLIKQANGNVVGENHGFAELRTAYKLNERYFPSVLEFVWLRSNAVASVFFERLAPLNATEKYEIAEFLLDREAISETVSLVCREDAVNAADREQLVARLLQNEQYRAAYLVDQKNCADKTTTGKITNPDFETAEISQKLGFDWRIGRLPETISAYLIENQAFRGNQNLKLVFNGNSNAADILLSQLVAIEKHKRYRFAFAFKVNNLVTGGVPVLQVIKVGHGNSEVVVQQKITGQNDKWQNQSYDFATDEKTEAIEIKLVRDACPTVQCPAFGELQLDAFELTAK